MYQINKSYIVQTETDENGDTILPIPQEILEHLNLKEGDSLDIEEKNGSLFLKPKKKLFAIEKLVSFRSVIFVEAKEAEHACDEVVCNENLQYFQKNLPTETISISEVSILEAQNILYDQEYESISEIKSDEMFLNNLVNKEV